MPFRDLLFFPVFDISNTSDEDKKISSPSLLMNPYSRLESIPENIVRPALEILEMQDMSRLFTLNYFMNNGEVIGLVKTIRNCGRWRRI